MNRIQLIADKIEQFFGEATKACCGKDCDNCCSGCASSNGHFDYFGVKVNSKFPHESKMHHVLRCEKIKGIPEAMEQLNRLKSIHGWSDKDGFWTSKGCRLPRTARSSYCQQTQCRWIGEYLKGKSWVPLDEAIAQLKEVRKELALLI